MIVMIAPKYIWYGYKSQNLSDCRCKIWKLMNMLQASKGKKMHLLAPSTKDSPINRLSIVDLGDKVPLAEWMLQT